MCLPDCPFCKMGIYGPAPEELVNELTKQYAAKIIDELRSCEDFDPEEFGKNNEFLLAVMAPFVQDAGRYLTFCTER